MVPSLRGCDGAFVVLHKAIYGRELPLISHVWCLDPGKLADGKAAPSRDRAPSDPS